MALKYIISLICIWVGLLICIGLPMFASLQEPEIPTARQMLKNILYTLLPAAALAGLAI